MSDLYTVKDERDRIEKKYVAIWQEIPRHPEYRIQSNDPVVIRKLRKRKTTSDAGSTRFHRDQDYYKGMRIFRLRYSSPKLAKQSICRLCGTKYGRLKEDASTDGFVSYTRTKLASKSGLKGGKV
jgi:hypothetical protein